MINGSGHLGRADDTCYEPGKPGNCRIISHQTSTACDIRQHASSSTWAVKCLLTQDSPSQLA